VSVSEGGRLLLREKLPLYFPRERLALSQRKATFVSGRGCLSAFHKENSLLAPRRTSVCLRGNVLLRFREERSLLQKEIVSVEMVSVSE
jgi:hypothetical protein